MHGHVDRGEPGWALRALLAVVLVLSLVACPEESEPGIKLATDTEAPDAGADDGNDTAPLPDDEGPDTGPDDPGPTPDPGPDVDPDPDVDDGDTGPADAETVEPDCVTADDCESLLDLGACEKAACLESECVAIAKDDGVPCDDGNACTDSDACAGGGCEGEKATCDDGDPCTTDTCDTDVGCMVTPSSGAPCDDGNECTKGEACDDGTCAGGELVCDCLQDADCAPFEDGDLCNGTLSCLANTCVIDPASIKVCDPELGTSCLLNACNPETGGCVLAPAPDGKICDDGNVCTDLDGCKAGACSGTATVCDDENACTKDVCNPAQGCVSSPANDGEACDDGSACTQDDLCAGGLCGGSGVICDDGNPCTDDGCDAEGGCVFSPNTAACDDGDPCTTNDSCLATICLPGAPLDCEDDNLCTDDGCVTGVGCKSTPNTEPCDDEDPCTLSDLCAEGACVGGPALECDDENACTDDGCEPGVGCQNAPNTGPCEDGNVCSKGDTCADGLCVGGPSDCGCESNSDCAEFEDGDLCNGTLICDKNKAPFSCKVDADTVVTCDASGDTTCEANTCDPATGLCSLQSQEEGLPCDDEDACTTADACKAGDCAGGPAPDCDDGDPCTADTCAAGEGCGHAAIGGVTCDDGNACTTGDVCEEGACTGGPPPDCDDGAPCTVDSCGALEGCTHTNVGLPCNDGNACTVNDVCLGGGCVGKGAPSCDDDNPCTADTCDPTLPSGCVHLPAAADCDDGDACTIDDGCLDAVCQPGAPLACDDGNVCTTDVCDPSVGCVFNNNEAPCDDDNACTTEDACKGGECGFGAAAKCDDGNDCTSDGCDPDGGCTHVANAKPCDDGDACTVGDTCADSACKGGGAANCNDGNPCTDDGCDPTLGCVSTANAAPCDDGNVCTVGEACQEKTCQGGDALTCSDGNPCTTDDCVPATGCSYPPIAGGGVCDDGNACTVGESCSEGACGGGTPPTCDDGKPCTLDSCDPASGCVTEDLDGGACDDGDACTVGTTCAAGACSGGEATTCTDNNPCTDDACQSPGGCTFTPNTQPCNDSNACTLGDVCGGGSCLAGAAALPCTDGNSCTTDGCDPAAGCTFTPTAGECDDGNPCTTGDTCTGGACAGPEAAACDDGNICTSDGCSPASGCTHIANTAPCEDGDPCTVSDVCADKVCKGGAAIPDCCTTDGDCSDGNACTADACLDGVCISAPGGTTSFSQDFESGDAGGFEFYEEQTEVYWHVDDTNTIDGNFALYWGNPTTHTYDYGDSYSEAIISSVKIPFGPALLSFRLFMDVEDSGIEDDLDVLTLWIDDEFVFEEGSSTGGWKQVTVDVSAFAGRLATLAFSMETGDELANNAAGVWIDNIELIGSNCAGAACAEHGECDDGSGCSGGLCVDGACTFRPSPPNQTWGEDFDDMPVSDPAAKPQGWTFASNNAALAWQVSDTKAATGQSLYAGNAGDNNYDFGAGTMTATTAKFRVPNPEESTLVFRLMMDVADDSCASDVFRVIVKNVTVFERCESTGGEFIDVGIAMSDYFAQDIQALFRFVAGATGGTHAGVYIDDVALVSDEPCGELAETFEDAVPFNFQTHSTSATTYWHVSTKAKSQGIRSFHMANPATHKYLPGPVDASATTAAEVCPTGVLSFALRNTVHDKNCEADVFTVSVGEDVLYTKCDNTTGFDTIEVDLSAYGNMTVPVTFRFVADAANNNDQGPYIDQVVMLCP